MGTLTRALSVNTCSTDGLRVKERSENFPVALRVLPRRYREALRAVYDVVRVIDDLGDAAEGDRLAKLDDLERDLYLAWREGTPTQAPVRRLVPFIEAHGL